MFILVTNKNFIHSKFSSKRLKMKQKCLKEKFSREDLVYLDLNASFLDLKPVPPIHFSSICLWLVILQKHTSGWSVWLIRINPIIYSDLTLKHWLLLQVFSRSYSVAIKLGENSLINFASIAWRVEKLLWAISFLKRGWKAHCGIKIPGRVCS